MMKLALIRQRYNPHGGAERFVSRALETLSENNELKITLLTRKWKNAASNNKNNYQIEICNPFYLGNVWRDWSFARAIQTQLATQSFDLIQSHERIAGCDIYRAGDGVHREWLFQRARVLSMPQRVGMRLNPYHAYTLQAEYKLFTDPRLKAVICNSRMVKHELQQWFDFPEEKIHVIYSGVDNQVFHPKLKTLFRETTRRQLGISDEATVLLFVGSGFARKNLSLVLQALHLLQRDNIHLLVVGADKQLAGYRQLAETFQVRAHFVGGQADVLPYYGASDIFVLPTLYDPFPNVCLEAFASGLPVITSTKSGAAEFIRDGENGFVCDALDLKTLTEQIEALTNPQERAVMSRFARQTILPFSLTAMGKELTSLYKKIIAL